MLDVNIVFKNKIDEDSEEIQKINRELQSETKTITLRLEQVKIFLKGIEDTATTFGKRLFNIKKNSRFIFQFFFIQTYFFLVMLM